MLTTSVLSTRELFLHSSFLFDALVEYLTPPTMTLGAYTLYRLANFVWKEYISNPLNDFPGPPSPSWLYGNLQQILDAENSVMHEQWVGEYGSTIKYKGFLGSTRLYTVDLKAINHVLMNSQVYQKTKQSRSILNRILGNGVLIVEGTKHREQVTKGYEPGLWGVTDLRIDRNLCRESIGDVWAAEIKNQSQGEEQTTKINVLSGLSKMTLDVIGLAGFNYKFNSLQGERSELNEAFNAMLNPQPRMSVIFVLRGLLGRFSYLLPVESDKPAREARETMDRIGRQLLNDSKAALEKADEKNERFKRRDLLSLLLKANMSTDVPENQRMSDQDVLDQVPIFLVAGHETTSGTTWALYALSFRLGVQSKLCEELYTVPTDNPSMDELNALPYLDAVVREMLRVHSPVLSTLRVAVKDDVIPLEHLSLIGRGGSGIVFVRKGQTLFVPILAINRATEIWEGANAVPGVWGNVLTFLSRPRACVGYRFSLVEMKALLFTLVRAFEFRLVVPPNEIGKKSSVVQRPVLVKDVKAGSQLPLLVTPYVHVH